MATVFHRSHQLQDAAMHYNEAIRLNPNFAECHTNLGTSAVLVVDGKQSIAFLPVLIRLFHMYSLSVFSLCLSFYFHAPPSALYLPPPFLTSSSNTLSLYSSSCLLLFLLLLRLLLLLLLLFLFLLLLPSPILFLSFCSSHLTPTT